MKEEFIFITGLRTDFWNDGHLMKKKKNIQDIIELSRSVMIYVDGN